MVPVPGQPEAIVLDRYIIHGEIAAGGMATVHLGRQLGPGTQRTVAVKRLHPQYAKNPDFCGMFLDEARLAARIRHPNVVPILDVAQSGGELFMVMEYLHGEPLSQLLRSSIQANRRIPPPIVVAIIADVLRGLHAAHEASDESGAPLSLVHRDISPQNILVGIDGLARVIDFGVAKAAGRSYTTQDGQIKGKLAYMAPEQLQGERLDRRADLYATGIVLWESLTAERLFMGSGDAPDLSRLLDPDVEPPSARVPGLPAALDRVTLRALSADREARFPTAHMMALALTSSVQRATAAEVGAWVKALARERLAERAEQIAAMGQPSWSTPTAMVESIPQSGRSPQNPMITPMPQPPPPQRTVESVRGAPIFVPGAMDNTATLLRPMRPEPPPAAVSPAPAPVPSAAAAELLSPKISIRPLGSTTEASVMLRRLSEMPTEQYAAQRRRPRNAALALMFVSLALGGLLAALLFSGRLTAPPTHSALTAKPPLATATSMTTATATAPPVAPVAETTEPLVFETPAPSASAPPTTARPYRMRPPRRSNVSCDPPFTIDDKGHKRYKRECF